MNWMHRRLCASRPWRAWLTRDLLPWALTGIPGGGTVLEIGPGPGAATDVLLTWAQRLTCVEVDSALARTLARRLTGRDVDIRCEDATSLSAPDASFDTVVCLMMLHHVAPAARQDRLLAEAARVLRPGGTFVLLDSRPSRLMDVLHVRDTMLLSDPGTFADRLTAAGFDRAAIDVRSHSFRAVARRPDAQAHLH
ncbi:MAG: hypothetical protein ABS36_04525 [Acidobacteria bacterium SCN 69-37]|nr:MAG: hypothetical protein ABS36_04525 [Acidobacteria bacterium SCN 69-37]